MKKLNGKSKDIVKDNIDKLKSLFPDVFTEDGIDFDALKGALGEYVDDKDERYQFTWHGKSQARRLAQTPSTGTLRPCKDESMNWDTTENLFIEGDNLEVLKLLQKSYNKKIKMIYIDPPYNTGKDFVYKDDFRDNIKNYKELTGQVDNEGKTLSTNSETSGRYHTDWLNMMYPRLKLARALLRNDGVIFISIDDNEVVNLKKVCDEIFGEDNFVAKYIHKNNSTKNQAKLVSISTEYFYCYAKNKALLKDIQWRLKKGAEDIAKMFCTLKAEGLTLEEIETQIKEMYKRPKYSHLSRWNKVDDKGVFKDADLSREGGSKDYTIINPETGAECAIPNRGWGKSKDELLRLQQEGLIWYGEDDTPPGLKDYINPDDISVPDNFWYYDNSVDTRWIKNEFGSLVFQNPKPLEMLKNMVEMVNLKEGELLLDFFSGSCTSAHATLDLNKEDKGSRKFIMIQLPEILDDTETKIKDNKDAIEFLKSKGLPINLAEIGKERIRRIIKKIETEQKESKKKDDETLFDKNSQAEIKPLNLGFKVFKLDSSNISMWDPDFDTIQQDILSSVDNIKTDRAEEDVLYEILLKYGLDLTLPIEEIEIKGKKVFVIGLGSLIVCLASDLTVEVIEEIAKLKDKYQPEVEMRVVFKDSSFKDDVVKTNAIQILKQNGIEDVKSI